jgi:hypothetical protein
MTLGYWLDEAHGTAAQAAAAIEDHGIPVADMLAAFFARDRAWLSLARLADLVRGARLLGQSSLASATAQLSDPRATPIRLLSAGAHAAVVRPVRSADLRLAAAGPVAGLVIDAADRISIAADILATHIQPRRGDDYSLLLPPTGDPALNALTANRHLTMLGAAIVGGAERAEVVGELARIADTWIDVDRALGAGDNPATAYLGRVEAEHMHRWVTGAFPPFFARHARKEPALALRQIQAAMDSERSAGLRPVDSLSDVLRTLTDISTAIKRDPRLVTAALLSAISRIGFGLEILAGSAAGEDEPSRRTRTRASRWKDVAQAVKHVRDLRDDVAPVYAEEANLAADWIRNHTRQLPTQTPADPYDLSSLQRQLATVATQSIEPWRRALLDGEILATFTDSLDPQGYKGIKPFETTWKIASSLNPRGREVLYRLVDAAANAHPALKHAANSQGHQLRREEALTEKTTPVAVLRERRRQLQQAVKAIEISVRSQHLAAYTHGEIERLRADNNYTNDAPHTAMQQTLRHHVDALERELAHQQHRWQTARAAAEMFLQAAELPLDCDLAQAMQELDSQLAAAQHATAPPDNDSIVQPEKPGSEVPAEFSAVKTRQEETSTTTPSATELAGADDPPAGTHRQRAEAENVL